MIGGVNETMTSPAWDPGHVPLGTLIFRAGLLTEEQIQDSLREGERTGKRLGEVLVERGLLSEKEVARLLAEQGGLEFVDLEVRPPDRDAVELLRAETARRYGALPFAFEDGTPLVAVTDVANEMTTRAVQEELARDVRFVVAAQPDLAAAIAAAYAPVAEPALATVASVAPSHAGNAPVEVGFEPPVASTPRPVAPLAAEPTVAPPPAPPPVQSISHELHVVPPTALPAEERAPDPDVAGPVEERPAVSDVEEPPPFEETEPAAADALHWGGPLGELLLESGLLTNEQLEDALGEAARRGRRLGEIVLERGWVHERTLAHCLASQKAMPFVSVRDRSPDPEAVKLLPRKTAERYAALPVELDGVTPVVAISDPTNEAGMASVRAALGADVRFAVAAMSELASALDRAYDALEPVPVVPPQPHPSAERESAGQARPETAPSRAGSFHVAIRLVNSEAVEVGTYESAAEAEAEAAAVVKRLASTGPAEWPSFRRRFLRPDAIVSVDIVDET